MDRGGGGGVCVKAVAASHRQHVTKGMAGGAWRTCRLGPAGPLMVR